MAPRWIAASRTWGRDGVREALLEHKVVFLRGQRMDDAAQAGFARRFGDLTPPTRPSLAQGQPSVFELDAQRAVARRTPGNRREFVDRPRDSVLRAITLPPYGGDTSWANTVTAYESCRPP